MKAIYSEKSGENRIGATGSRLAPEGTEHGDALCSSRSVDIFFLVSQFYFWYV